MQIRLPNNLLIISCSEEITIITQFLGCVNFGINDHILCDSKERKGHPLPDDNTVFSYMLSCTPIFTNYKKIIIFMSYFVGNKISTLILSYIKQMPNFCLWGE